MGTRHTSSAGGTDESATAAQKKERPKRFAGIELGPGILSFIQRKARKDDWNQQEIDAYYEVLDFARKTPYVLQKAKARENVLADIERYRDEVRAEYAKRIKRYDKLAADNPDSASRYGRLKRAAGRLLKRRLARHREFAENPRDFPIFARMTTSLLKDEPSRFHGKLVTLSGHVRKLISYKVFENAFGIDTVYEAWIYTHHSGGNPAVVICTSVPEGMPRGENISEECTVTGYVFRLHWHPFGDESDKGRIRPSPMILAGRMEWRPRTAGSTVPPWVYVSVFLAVVGVVVVIVWVARRDKFSRKQRQAQALEAATPDLSPSALDGFPTENDV